MGFLNIGFSGVDFPGNLCVKLAEIRVNSAPDF